MKRKCRAFTLIELLMVMLIIGIVIAMLMKIGPEVSRNIKVHQTKNFLHVLDLGAHRYKRIFGAFPTSDSDNHDNNPYDQSGPNCYTQRAAGFYLYIALQGPDSYGWSRTEHEVSADFGPFLEAGATNVGQAQIGDNNSPSWPVFIDSFNKGILYQKARRSSPNPPNLNKTSGEENAGTRYGWYNLRSIWGGQSGIGGWSGRGQMWTVAQSHWKQKLTMAIQGHVLVPYNPESFILWSAGADEKFGYWHYEEGTDGSGYHWNLEEGVCDDITNFD